MRRLHRRGSPLKSPAQLKHIYIYINYYDCSIFGHEAKGGSGKVCGIIKITIEDSVGSCLFLSSLRVLCLLAVGLWGVDEMKKQIEIIKGELERMRAVTTGYNIRIHPTTIEGFRSAASIELTLATSRSMSFGDVIDYVNAAKRKALFNWLREVLLSKEREDYTYNTIRLIQDNCIELKKLQLWEKSPVIELRDEIAMTLYGYCREFVGESLKLEDAKVADVRWIIRLVNTFMEIAGDFAGTESTHKVIGDGIAVYRNLHKALDNANMYDDLEFHLKLMDMNSAIKAIDKILKSNIERDKTAIKKLKALRKDCHRAYVQLGR